MGYQEVGGVIAPEQVRGDDVSEIAGRALRDIADVGRCVPCVEHDAV